MIDSYQDKDGNIPPQAYLYPKYSVEIILIWELRLPFFIINFIPG